MIRIIAFTEKLTLALRSVSSWVDQDLSVYMTLNAGTIDMWMTHSKVALPKFYLSILLEIFRTDIFDNIFQLLSFDNIFQLF